MTSADTKLTPLPKIDPSDRLGAVVPVVASSALEGADLTNVIVLSRRRSATDIEAPAVKVSDSERPAPWLPWPDRAPWTALIAGGTAAASCDRCDLPARSGADAEPRARFDLGRYRAGRTDRGRRRATAKSGGIGAVAAGRERTRAVEPEQPTETVEQIKPELRPRIGGPREPPREPTARRTEARGTANRRAGRGRTRRRVLTEPEPTPTVAEKRSRHRNRRAGEAEAGRRTGRKSAAAAERGADRKAARTIQAHAAAGRRLAERRRRRVLARSPRLGEPRFGASRAQQALSAAKRSRAASAAPRSWHSRSTAAGNVGAVRLVRSSGNASLDRESQDLVRRAAPFPAPPQGKASITVPVNFNVMTGR